LATLDAVSEEINTALFRRGHVALGLSSSLCGSAMAFDYQLYRQEMQYVSSSGEDKELEMRLLKKRIRVAYSSRMVVLDEKTQRADAFVSQRARWIANQIMQARANFGEGIKQLFRGNVDFFNKALQHFVMPRVMLLASAVAWTLVAVCCLPHGYKWVWPVILSVICGSMLISVPRRMYNAQLLKAMLYLPMSALLMFRSLFVIKGATKTFHATEHQSFSKEIDN
jgi:cellulose synthase/poly-beta-1,6-N-acetylglucosamine synthase-like glycosyltransferase